MRNRMRFAVIACAALLSLSGCTVDRNIKVSETDRGVLEKRLRDTANTVAGYREGARGARLAGHVSDEGLAKYIEERMKDIGLDTKKASIPLDSWNIERADITLDCTCNESGTYTIKDMGLYPIDIAESGSMMLVDIGSGKRSEYSEKELYGKYALVTDRAAGSVTDLEEALIEKGVKGIVVGSGHVDHVKLDVEDAMPTRIPVLVASESKVDFIRKNMTGGEIEIDVDIKSEIVKDKSSTMVWGDIKGTSRDVVYITMSRDTLFNSFIGKGVGIGEFFEIMERVKKEYKPKHTIRFLVTTGQEWGEVDGGRNAGLKALLETRPDWVKDARAVFVLDGWGAYGGGISKSILTTGKLKDIVKGYEKEFYEGQDKYGYKVSVEGLEKADKVTEADVWAKEKVDVIVQNEQKGTAFYERDRGTGDKITLPLDISQSEYTIDYFTGLIKRIDGSL